MTTKVSSSVLSTTGVIASTYGSGTTTPVITVDAQGRITSATAVTITGGSAGIGATTFNRQSFTATAGQTSFTISGGYTAGYVHVYVNGVLLNTGDYTASNGTTVVLGTGANANDIIDVFTWTVTTVLSISGGSGGKVLYQSAANTTSFTAAGNQGEILISNGTGAPTWMAQTSLSLASSQITGSFANTVVGLGYTSNPQFGSIGVGTTASGTSGEIRAAGDITSWYSSDERLKSQIKLIDNALDKVSVLEGVTFNWNALADGKDMEKREAGVIAQQVQKVLPEIVVERDNGYLAVRYEQLVPLLIEAIKELKAEVDILKGNNK